MYKIRWVVIFLVGLFISGCVGRASTLPENSGPSLLPAQAMVAEVEVLRIDAGSTEDVRLLVRGTLNDGCTRLGEAVVERQGRLFSINMPASRIDSAACGEQVDFERVVRLPIESAEAGNYAALVNGFLTTFTLKEPDRVQEPIPVAPSAENPPLVGDVQIPVPAAINPAADPGVPVTSNIVPISTSPGTQPYKDLRLPYFQRGCENKAGIFEDGVEQGSNSFLPGEKFVKTWKVRNEGTCTWGEGYSLIFVGGNAMGSEEKQSLPATEPGAVVEISVQLTAPEAPGTYTSAWGFSAPGNVNFGTGAAGLIPLEARIGVKQKPPELPNNLECGTIRDPDMEAQVLDLINAERLKIGLAPVRIAEDLSQVAYIHSVEMACNNRMSHYGLDGMLYTGRLQKAGVPFVTANEMIYAGNGKALGSVDWWMKSDIHRPIIQSSKYTLVGIGYVTYERIPYKQRITVVFTHP